MYRVGLPGWKLAAKFGAPLFIRLEAIHDKEAGVFVITSPDLRGLVVETPDNCNAQDLLKEVNGCIDMLMRETLKAPPKNRPVTAWTGEFQLA